MKKETERIETLPALDNAKLREEQMKRVVTGISELGAGMKEIGDMFKENKKVMKWDMRIGLAMIALLLFIIGGGIITSLSTTGIDGFFDMSDANRYFICSSHNMTDRVKNYDDAKSFVELFNGTCQLGHYKQIDYYANESSLRRNFTGGG